MRGNNHYIISNVLETNGEKTLSTSMGETVGRGQG